MPVPSVSNTFVDGTTITAGGHNTNWSDIINCLTDGTKDLTVLSVTATTITPTTIGGTPNFTGNVTFAGNVTLGNATADTATVSGELAGSRMVLCFGPTGNDTDPFGGDFYMGASNGATERSFVMPRAGSVVGYSVQFNCSARTSTTIFQPIVRKNNANLISGNTMTINATGFFADRGTALRGVNTFVAGDRIGMFIDNSTVGGTNGVGSAIIEVQFDS